MLENLVMLKERTENFTNPTRPLKKGMSVRDAWRALVWDTTIPKTAENGPMPPLKEEDHSYLLGQQKKVCPEKDRSPEHDLPSTTPTKNGSNNIETSDIDLFHWLYFI
jgi:hypothetical protein|tara:strand:- start:362 stop:685 length:324 start_codon:yes stop_codon:yes gene_type:complete